MVVLGLVVGAILLVGGAVLGTWIHAKTNFPNWK